MTAIAYRDGMIAADRQSTFDNISHQFVKIRTMEVHTLGWCVVAMSGYIGNVERMCDILKYNIKGTGTALVDYGMNNSYGLICDSLGKVYRVYGDGLVGSAEINEFLAEGSAFGFLCGAMAQGVTAQEAVKLACKHCDGVGQAVDVVNVMEELQPYINLERPEGTPW